MSELPKGWTETELKELVPSDAPILYGILQPGPDLEDGVPYVRPTEITEDVIQLDELRRTSDSISEKYKRSILKAEDIILSMVGTIGKVAIVPPILEGGNITQSAVRIRPNKDVIDPRYLTWLLRSPGLRRQYDANRLGTAVPRLNVRDIRTLKAPIPPLPEQRRIVARIEELFSRLDAGIAALRHAKAQLQRYRQSVLAAAVTGELTKDWRDENDVQTTKWDSLSIGDVSEVKTGKTPKRRDPEFWTNGNIPWLTSSATNNDFTHQADQFVTQAALDAGLKLFDPGTLLLAMYGEGKTRGQVTEITFQATCNQACAAIIVDDTKAFRPFVRLRLQESYEQTRKAASGGNQPNLNLTKVREIPLQLPPLAEQSQIVAEVEARTTAIDHLEAELDRQIARSNRLRQSTLAAAFSGQLSR